MCQVLVVYASDWGHTKRMAEAVAEGVLSVSGTRVEVKSAEAATADDLVAADAVVVGTPVHMGSPDWRVKRWIDQACSALWLKDAMVGKVGAVFATGSGFGNAGGGCELAMLALLSNFAELGMIIVPLPKNTPGYARGGLHWGPYGRSASETMTPGELSAEALETARRHGANVARVAAAVSKARLLGG
ncbi:MAG: NAD(P)H-dependent oxidoreductase [Kiritimatiellae bacterium]|nr:NAD(P)H-dependent oxidoreductase [Kiritimatiellia bacterium]